MVEEKKNWGAKGKGEKGERENLVVIADVDVPSGGGCLLWDKSGQILTGRKGRWGNGVGLGKSWVGTAGGRGPRRMIKACTIKLVARPDPPAQEHRTAPAPEKPWSFPLQKHPAPN